MDKKFRERMERERKTATDAWYKKIEGFRPIPGRDYGWIWDYAKYRFDWAFEKTRYVEQKGDALLKLVLSLAAGAWIIFGVLLRYVGGVAPYTLLLLGAAVAYLALSGHYALESCKPSAHVYPQSEDEAAQYANYYDSKDAAIGHFLLQFADSTEQERFLTIEKGHYVNRGTRYAIFAVALFTVALFGEVCRQTLQSSASWGLVPAWVVRLLAS